MPRKRFDHLKAQMDLRLTEVFFKAMQENQFISADTIWNYARLALMPPREATTRLASNFRRYIASGYLRRTGRYVTSSRNDSSPLRLYESTLFAANSKAVPKQPFELGSKEHGNGQNSQ
jgi:hypothetical protein